MSNISDPIDYEKFERLVKDGLANLFDLTALQTHPLTRYFNQSTSISKSRGEYLRDKIHKAIEHLQPVEGEMRPGTPEWRPYLILRWRYMDAIQLVEIQERLALSGRQFRREHGRAVKAVATFLWDQITPAQPSSLVFEKDSPPSTEEPSEEDAALSTIFQFDEAQPQEDAFTPHKTPLDVFELLQGVTNTLQKLAQMEGVALNLLPCVHLPKVSADRVILRQILISLISYAMEMTLGDVVTISCEAQFSQILVCLEVMEPTLPAKIESKSKLLDKANFLAQKIDADIHWTRTEDIPGKIKLWISLPYANEPLLLAVDDHDIALRMYRRYTSHKNIQLVGLQDGGQVIETARELQPQIIILDVMIPNMDGWEVLQALRANPATNHIPVIVSTVWDEPDLAFSLGAAGFLKKPFSQQEFLAELARFGMK